MCFTTIFCWSRHIAEPHYSCVFGCGRFFIFFLFTFLDLVAPETEIYCHVRHCCCLDKIFLFFLFSSCFLWNCVSLLWYLQLSQICTSGTTSFAYLRSQLRDCLHYQLACPMSPLSGCSLNCNYVLERPWTYLANSLKRPIEENMLVVGC